MSEHEYNEDLAFLSLDGGAMEISWLIRKDNEERNGEIRYCSRGRGNAAWASGISPRIILNIGAGTWQAN